MESELVAITGYCRSCGHQGSYERNYVRVDEKIYRGDGYRCPECTVTFDDPEKFFRKLED